MDLAGKAVAFLCGGEFLRLEGVRSQLTIRRFKLTGKVFGVLTGALFVHPHLRNEYHEYDRRGNDQRVHERDLPRGVIQDRQDDRRPHDDAAAPPEVEVGVPNPLNGMDSAPLDKQAALAGQPALASSLPAGSAQLAKSIPQGSITDIADPKPIEAASADPSPASPALGVPTMPASPAVEESGAKLASASMNAEPLTKLNSGAAAVTSEAVSAGNSSHPAAVSAAEAAKPQVSIYAQAANSGSQDRAEFRSIRAFDNAWNSAVAQLQKGQWSEALLTLSFFFHDPDITGEERQRLLDLLDPLAGKVIYSPDHTLEAPYQVKPGERLETIAEQFRLPVSLLQNINAIANPQALQPGTQLKVLRGPFRAEIDLKRSEMVLFLGKYYAGRFAVSVGNDPAPQASEYQVLAKEAGREYTGANGIRIPARSADNPYGALYLDLGNRVGIHGSPDTLPPSGLGCLSLSAADVADVYGILSVGSKVTVR